MTGDLSPWRRERRGACIGSLTISSLTLLKTKQHLILTSLSSDTFDSRWPCSAKALWSPLTVSTHKSLTYDSQLLRLPSYNFSWRAQMRVTIDMHSLLAVVNNLSEELPVINDTTNLSEGSPVINDTTDLIEGLPVINNTSTMTT